VRCNQSREISPRSQSNKRNAGNDQEHCPKGRVSQHRYSEEAGWYLPKPAALNFLCNTLFCASYSAGRDRQTRNLFPALIAIRQVRDVLRSRSRRQPTFCERTHFVRVEMVVGRLSTQTSGEAPQQYLHLWII
jgi:hypothetical protein